MRVILILIFSQFLISCGETEAPKPERVSNKKPYKVPAQKLTWEECQKLAKKETKNGAVVYYLRVNLRRSEYDEEKGRFDIDDLSRGSYFAVDSKTGKGKGYQLLINNFKADLDMKMKPGDAQRFLKESEPKSQILITNLIFTIHHIEDRKIYVDITSFEFFAKPYASTRPFFRIKARK
jgi:hypothetical protein